MHSAPPYVCMLTLTLENLCSIWYPVDALKGEQNFTRDAEQDGSMLSFLGLLSVGRPQTLWDHPVQQSPSQQGCCLEVQSHPSS